MNPLRFILSLFQPVPRVRPAEIAARVRAGEVVLIDVREPAEWADGIAQGAVPLSLRDLSGRRGQWGPFLAAHDGRELAFYCGHGVRASMAARVLRREGHRTLNTGSLRDWVAAGWPVVRPARKS
ncbi:MAG: rhodanese-like domain-containing protein [Opitutaceae bacterium]|nr:rhodanese-like domain-containing protein [Opitutaceae bacterium]